MSSDDRPFSEAGKAPADLLAARRGAERIGKLLEKGEADTPREHGEQALPYADLLQQRLDRIPSPERDRMRVAEQSQIAEVSVADLPDPPDVAGPEDHHITYDNAVHHTRQLHEVVLPWVRVGAVKDDFIALDRALGTDDSAEPNERSFTRTYELFFGGNPIKLDQTSAGAYTIIDGRHRIYAARALGVPSLPARVSRAQQ